MRGLHGAVCTVRIMTLVALGLGLSTAFAAEGTSNQKSKPSSNATAQRSESALPEAQGPLPTKEPPSGPVSIEDLLLEKGTITKDEWIQIRAGQEYRAADQQRRLDSLEEWKSKTEILPILRDKVNFGLNALQFQYGHTDTKVPEGRSQDSLTIRRAELIFWGKLSEYLPRWHMLMEFQSNGLTNNTPAGATGAGTPTSANFFREAYIDIRPIQSWAPNLNIIRMGIDRMPFGIFTQTSGGLRDIISSPYLTAVGGGGGPGQNKNGTGGAIEFIQERDYFIDVRGKIADRLEYVVGIMNNNNFQANSLYSSASGIGGANGPKAVYTRIRLFGDDVSFVSFTTIQGESNNAGTFINGRGKGRFDRYGVDLRYTSKHLPGFVFQGEYWQGHDGANATTVGTPAKGDCLDTAVCGGSGAPGMNRRTWYVLAKYLISDGPLKNVEPVVMYEQFDPNTTMSNDLYTRTIIGFNYYFENFPPKLQSKIQFNYEFRHHAGLGTGLNTPAYNSATDPFANNAFFLMLSLRYM